MIQVADHTLLADYTVNLRRLRLRQSTIGCVATLILVPLGASLDLLVYPDLAWDIFQARMLCDAAVGTILVLHFTAVGRAWIRTLGFLWVLMPTIAISWMVYLSEGSTSPYYAGLLLVMTGVCTLFPWTVSEAFACCLAIISCFLIACAAHRDPISPQYLYNSLFFLGSTAALCITGCYYSSRRRFEDFCLRHELDIRNREIATSYDKLTEMEGLRTQFFANISHELRTPLTLIIAPLEDLLRSGQRLPDGAAEAIGVARQNALRLLKLINDLLEIVRIDEKGVELRREPVDLASFVPGIAESINYLIDAKGLRLICAGERAPLPVLADLSRLEKMMLNLLTNAIKFTPKGGSIEVRWRREGRSAVIEVADSGVGIPAGELPHIFDRFRQVDGSSTRKYQGAGIGLALVRDLVREHQGEMSVDSTLNQGTTMRITLPLQAEGQLPSPAPVAASAQTDSDPLADIYRAAERRGGVILDEGEEVEKEGMQGAGEAVVLVVDDEPDMRRYLVSRLVGEHRVLQSDHGLRALEMIRAERPDLVLLDLMLPGMDGLDVCREVRKDPSLAAVKIVLLTARMDEGSKIAALESGADDFLTKPFSTIEVRTRIAGLLRTATLQEAVQRRASELEQALKRLKETESQLVQSEKMSALGTIAAGLLHEVNNPLNFTLTALQVAYKLVPKDDADVKEVLDDIGQGMRRVKHIVSDLGMFAHKSPGQDSERVDLAEVIESARRLTGHELSGIEVASAILPGTFILGSRTQLSHVFMNLLLNSAKALRASSGRPPRIAISGQARDGRLGVIVRDNGLGIPADVLPRIFEPFFTTRTVGQGTGLGLSICHTIITNHGGSMSARSEPGQWTEMIFDLTAAPPRPEDKEAHQ